MTSARRLKSGRIGATGAFGDEPGWEVVLVAAPFVLPVVAAIYLGFRLRGRGAAASAPPS